jgi:hypothetical protein
LNLGRRERPIVHAHFINRARKVFAPRRIAPDPQRIARRRERPRYSPTAHLHAVDIQAQGRPIPRRGHVRPAVCRQCRAAKHFLIAANVHAPDRPAATAGVQFIDRIHFLQHDRAPAAAHRRRHPCFQRQRIHQIQRGRIIDGDPTGAAVERQAAAITPGRPGRVQGRPRVVLARGIGYRRAAVLIQPQCQHQSS